MKNNKYIYLYVVQVNYGYGYGWEDLASSETTREIKQDLKAYKENERGSYRIIHRRVLAK